MRYGEPLAESEMYISPEMSQRHAEILAKSCTNQAIQAQIDLLEELLKDTENTNAKFRLKLRVKIQELEKKIA